MAGRARIVAPALVSVALLALAGSTSALLAGAPSGSPSSKFVGGYGPTWSPDGSEIAFIGPAPPWVFSPSTENRVLVVSADGSMSPHVVSIAPLGQNLAEVRWADAGWFIYQDSNFTLWADTGTRGNAARKLAIVGSTGWDSFTLSPNGRMVAFTAPCNCKVPQGTEVGVVSVPVAGGKARILPHPANAIDSHPSFSPNGREVIFSRILMGKNDQYWPQNQSIVMEPVGGGTARQLHIHGDWPVFSPNGRWIAFASTSPRPGGSLEVVPASGGKPRLLIPKPKGTVVGPFAWSPDSTKLLFVDDTRIGTVDLYGNATFFSLPGLRPGLGTPQWSPNGTLIAFTAINKESSLDSRVYVITPTRTDLRRIG